MGAQGAGNLKYAKNRFRAYLRITSDSLEFEEILESLNVDASHIGKKGDPYPEIPGTFYQKNTCLISTEPSDTRLPREHIEELCIIIQKHMDKIKPLSEYCSLEISFICEPTCSFTLIEISSRSLKILHEIGIPFTIGIALSDSTSGRPDTPLFARFKLILSGLLRRYRRK